MKKLLVLMLMMTCTIAMVLAQDSTGVGNPIPATDFTAIFTAILAIYEIIARLVKTKSNWSLIDMLWALVGWILPNSKDGTAFKWPWQKGGI